VKQPLKHSQTPLDLDMFPMVEIRYFKTINVELYIVIELWGYYKLLQDYKIYEIVIITWMRIIFCKFGKPHF